MAADDKRTAAMLACEADSLECLEAVLAAGGNIDAADENGWTPLWYVWAVFDQTKR